MRIRITKHSDERHRLEILREAGGSECAELETRSMLLHDLLHFAVEETAGLGNGFYGRLAAGATLASFRHGEPDAVQPSDAGDPSLAMIEGVVGILTGFAKGASVHDALALWERVDQSGSRQRPVWVNAAFLERVRARLRELTGHWKALRFGESMELTWVRPRSWD